MALIAGVLLLPVAGASSSRGLGRSAPGIVDVTAHLGYQGLDTLGTGMLDASGEVLTNNHVIRGATAIRVSDLDNGQSYPATVVGYDVSADVAVLRLENAPKLKAVVIDDSSKARVGDAVKAIGNTGGVGGTPSSTTGKVVGFGRSITAIDESGAVERLTGLIEVSAQLTPGDSGGPLVNAAGEVIGMSTAGSGHFPGQGFNNDGFAIPINRVISIANVINGGRSSETVHVGPTAFLGANTESPGHLQGSRAVGALVTGVLPRTPASRIGLARGDILYAVDGRTLTTPAALTNKLAHLLPGTLIRLAWIDQAEKTHRATVRLASGPPD